MHIAFKEGQTSRPGDPLFQIDPRPYQVALEQAQGALARDKALLANARVDLERYQTLFAQDSIAEQQLATQKSLVLQDEGTVKTDQAQIDTAKLNLTYCHIVSPDRRPRRPAAGQRRQLRDARRAQRPGRRHAAEADHRGVHAAGGRDPAAAEAAARRRHAAGDRLRPQQHAPARHRHAAVDRQPDRYHHRHDQAEGDLSPTTTRACSRSSSSTSCCCSTRCTARRSFRRPACSAARPAPTSTSSTRTRR